MTFGPTALGAFDKYRIECTNCGLTTIPKKDLGLLTEMWDRRKAVTATFITEVLPLG